ncbi:MAG TPA: hypothetical protein VF133_09140 [Terriglobales bacterium]
MLALIACAFLCPSILFAQPKPVHDITVCELRLHAGEFDHETVRVRGTADLEFEIFALYDPQCKDTKATDVWLTFGGDVSDIATYCCGDHSRRPGHVLELDGKPVPLRKDGAFEQFYKLVRASRNRTPTGAPCASDCHFYRVTATLTGVFLAEKNTEKEHLGYGHLGCCSLLIIEQVVGVSAERTAVPLSGAQNEPISCDEYATASPQRPGQQRQFEELLNQNKFVLAEKMTADSAEQLSRRGDQAWRSKPLAMAAHAILIRELQHWALVADPKLRLDKCTEPASLDEQRYDYASCSWYSGDGMQDFSVNFMRKKKNSPSATSSRSPWLLTSANARVCHVDAALATANIH